MATDGALQRDGPIALSALFDEALSQLRSRPDVPPSGDGFLYSGNRHESVPRALFLDRRLTPLERNAWQVFRLWLNDDGVTAFPTYDELRPFLASMPCAVQASHETVARALMLLRLTRWLSLVRRRRDPKTGRILGNLYVLHDESLTPFEVMQLDPDYLALVSHSLTHAARAVQIVGIHTLREIADDPLLNGRTLPTRLQVLAQRLAPHEPGPTSYPQTGTNLESEDGWETLLRNNARPSSESEAGPKPAPDGILRIPKEDSTVRNGSINEVRTVLDTREREELRLPKRFLALRQEQQTGALVALRQVEACQRQAVLDEWAARCRNSTVRNPGGYLFGIIQKAIRGEFKAWAAEDGGESEAVPAPPQPPPSPPSPPPTPRRAADPAPVRTCLEQIRAILRRR